MTIPTRDEALKALDKLSSEYDLAGGWSPDPMPLLATLRSYIESHTDAYPVQPEPTCAETVKDQARLVIEFMERETGLPFGDFIGAADRERIKAIANS